MPEQKGFERFTKSWSKLSMRIAMVAIALMLVVEVIDIVGAKLFSWSIPGGIDIVGLIAVFSASFAIASTEISGSHVRLDMGLNFFPDRIKTFCKKVSDALGILTFVLLIYASIIYLISLKKSGEASMTVGIPLYPFVLALIIGCIPILFVLVLELVNPKTIEKELDKL